MAFFLVFGYKLAQERLAHADTQFELGQAKKALAEAEASITNICKALGISYIRDPSHVVSNKMHLLEDLQKESYKDFKDNLGDKY